MEPTVNLQLPPTMYQRVKHRATQARRSIEDELVVVIANGLEIEDDINILPAGIAAELQQMAFLDDQALWRAAQQRVPNQKSERMQELVLKQQAEGFTEAERQEAAQLQHYAHLIMLVRAEAAVLLKERGLDISKLSRTSLG